MTVAELISALQEVKDPTVSVYVGGCAVEQSKIARVVGPLDESELEKTGRHRECVVIVSEGA